MLESTMSSNQPRNLRMKEGSTKRTKEAMLRRNPPMQMNMGVKAMSSIPRPLASDFCHRSKRSPSPPM